VLYKALGLLWKRNCWLILGWMLLQAVSRFLGQDLERNNWQWMSLNSLVLFDADTVSMTLFNKGLCCLGSLLCHLISSMTSHKVGQWESNIP
jgi:hypothetical protein